MTRRTWLGIAISALLLAIVLYRLDLREVGRALASANYLYVAVGMLLTVVVCLLRSLRWRFMFAPIRGVRIRDLFSVLMLGFLGNNVLPARLGDVGMVFFLSERTKVPKGLSLGIVVFDRFLDFMTLLFFLLAVTLVEVRSRPAWLENLRYLGSSVLLAGIVAVLLIVFCADAVTRLSERIARAVLPQRLAAFVTEQVSSFAAAFRAVKSSKWLPLVLLVSLAVWLTLGCGVFVLFRAVDLTLSFRAAITVLAIVNLGLILPSSPGFIGTFQFLCVVSLGLFGVSKESALGYSILYHATQFVPTTLLGLAVLHVEGIPWSSYAKSRRAQ